MSGCSAPRWRALDFEASSEDPPPRAVATHSDRTTDADPGHVGSDSYYAKHSARRAPRKGGGEFNAAQEDVIQNLFLGASYGLTFKQSLDNATTALAVAKGGMGDAAETGKSLAIIFNDCR